MDIVTAADVTGTQAFRAARDQLLSLRRDHDTARREFSWPRPDRFNWARDWVDVLAADPACAGRPALWIVDVDEAGSRDTVLTFAQVAARSARLAGWLAARGVRQGDRVLVMLGNQVELWETLLACIRLGAVVIPASTLLSPADLADRLGRGNVRHVVARDVDGTTFAGLHGGWTPVAVGGSPVEGWTAYPDLDDESLPTAPAADTAGTDPLLLYFTSGTTALPKLVEHTHTSYPIGHLSTMYWIGLQPGDVHLNISSPGWAKHAWSNLFAPWNAEATVLVVNQPRFAAVPLLETMTRCAVTSFCAPPTVWRMLVQTDLGAWKDRLALREVVGAGEPLNPEVIEQVENAWGITVRDGFGQTETTAQIGNPPGQRILPGSMGRPLPGYDVVLADPVSGAVHPTDTGAPGDGEICLRLGGAPAERPLGLMVGYRDDVERNGYAMRDGLYHTGDVASVDADGYVTYVGRADDVFKSSDYRISPFELESVLIEHPAVAEAAVVPSPDPVRLSVPKAYVVLAAGWEPTAATAADILGYARGQLAPYKRIRRIEFADLPKTISGKIRRVELRAAEGDRHGGQGGGEGTTQRAPLEFWESDLTP